MKATVNKTANGTVVVELCQAGPFGRPSVTISPYDTDAAVDDVGANYRQKVALECAASQLEALAANPVHLTVAGVKKAIKWADAGLEF